MLIKQSPIYLQDDNGMLGGVLIQQVLEVGGAGAQDHLVGFGMLPLEDFIKLIKESINPNPNDFQFNQVKATISPQWRWSRHKSSSHP